MNTTPEKLCEGFPNEFAKYLTMVKKLGFEEEPAYKEYIQMFNNLFTSKDFELDYAYDWVTVKNNTNVLKDASLIRSQEYSKQEDSKKNNEGVDSTIQGNNNNTNAMGNYPQNVIKEMEKDNNEIEEENKTPTKGKTGKGGNKEKCILF